MNIKKWTKKTETGKVSGTILDLNQPFFAKCDAYNFAIGASLFQSHQVTNKSKLISAYRI